MTKGMWFPPIPPSVSEGWRFPRFFPSKTINEHVFLREARLEVLSIKLTFTNVLWKFQYQNLPHEPNWELQLPWHYTTQTYLSTMSQNRYFHLSPLLGSTGDWGQWGSALSPPLCVWPPSGHPQGTVGLTLDTNLSAPTDLSEPQAFITVLFQAALHKNNRKALEPKSPKF